MRFDGKYLPVETKLSVNAEPNLIGQVRKYVFNSKVFLTEDGSRYVTSADFFPGKVLIIDTEKIYMYNAATNFVNAIFDLDQLKSKADLDKVEQAVRESLA